MLPLSRLARLAGYALLAASAAAAAEDAARFRYVMRGEVRLLLFWVGRDAVGGGHIRLRNGNSGREAWEEVEVVFGSDPARVPGRISRWGYGIERASRPAAADAPLTGSVFEGFMRYSPEQSVSEVKRSERDGGLRRYNAIRSAVGRDRARADIRIFEAAEEFDYRQPERLVKRFLHDIGSRPPDSHRELVNTPARYTEPEGFLTALIRMCREIAKAAGHPDGRPAPLPASTFVYNARPYRLQARKTDVRGGSARAEFESLNLEKGTRTAFTLEFPVAGEWRGIPSRIVLQPRWWLRLRLELAPD